MYGFCLRLESGFLLFFGTGLISELSNPAAGKMFTLLDFGSENRIVVMTISTIPMRQNRSISFLFNLKGGQGGIITYLFIQGVNDPTPYE